MKKLLKGEYFGNHYNKNQFNDLLVTDTEYTHKKVDWHYHQDPYFTYLLQGKLFEENKRIYKLKTIPQGNHFCFCICILYDFTKHTSQSLSLRNYFINM